MLIESDGTATEIAALMTAWAAAHQAEWHSLSELAAIGPVSRSSMERAMDKLESLGLVESQRMFNGQGYRLLVTVTMSPPIPSPLPRARAVMGLVLTNTAGRYGRRREFLPPPP